MTLAVFISFVALQFYRMREEEQTLLAAYPEYARYRASTPRLVPGLF
jgi:protein-S-isoprenylcysteine O-methyltransferase Ste14